MPWKLPAPDLISRTLPPLQGRAAPPAGRTAAPCLAASTGAGAADLYLIANPSLSLQASEVRDVYLGDKQFSGSVRLHPVDNAEAQEAFLEVRWAT